MGKILDSLKKYFSSTPKEQQDKDWEEMENRQQTFNL